MNDSEAQSPSPQQDQFVEKSAFDEDNEDDDVQASHYEETKSSTGSSNIASAA